MMIEPQLERYLNQIGVFYTFCNEPQDKTKLPVLVEKPVSVKAPVVQKPITVKSLQPQNKVSVKDLTHCKTLEDLRHEVDLLKDCALAKTATNTVFSDGNPHGPIMMIGEAPGAEEDLQGKPFVGQSGQLVDKMLKTIGLSREENIYITNTVFWRPPANRVPTDAELLQFYPYLERHILIHRPKVIVLLGGVAAKNVLKTDLGIVKLRERLNTFEHPELDKPIPVFAFYHPAYLLRSPRQKGTFWHDLLRLKRFLKEHNILDTQLQKAS